MSANYARAQLLIEQNRPQDALKELAQYVAAHPDQFDGYMLQAIAYLQLDELKKATAAAQTALSIEPDQPGTHYIAAMVYSQRNRLKEAETHIRTAIELDPEDADYHCLLASIFYERSLWQKALEQVEVGLTIDPENVDCINLKARCLQQLGRKEEARHSLQAAMNKDPDNSQTHANNGWQALRAGDRKKSLEHFRESLRLEPGNEWARQGMVEALKSGNILYRMMLGYMFWMASMTPGMRWGIIIGAYFLFRVASKLAANNPALQPFIYPILFCYIVFALSSWIADPLFNLMLRFSSAGKYILSEKERTETNLFGIVALLMIIFPIIGFLVGNVGWVFAGGAMFLSLVPLSGSFNCNPGWPQWAMGLYTAALIVIALFLSIGVVAFEIPLPQESVSMLANILIWGYIASFWVANILSGVTPKK